MSLSLRACCCALGCALCVSLRAGASDARPTTFTADPPVAIAERAVAAADEWLFKAVADCARLRERSQCDVLAIEEAFLEQLRKPRAAAVIDAGSPEDADDAAAAKPSPKAAAQALPTADAVGANADETANNEAADSESSNDETANNEKGGNLFVPLIVLSDRPSVDSDESTNETADEDLGVWHAISARLFGAEEYCEPGYVEQLASLARNLVTGIELPRLDLFSADVAGESDELPADQADEQVPNDQVPVEQAAVAAEPEAKPSNPLAGLQFWPLVTDEATAMSIIGPRTTAAIGEWLPSGNSWNYGNQGAIEVALLPAAPHETAEVRPEDAKETFENPAAVPTEERVVTPPQSSDDPWNSREETPSTIGGWDLED